MSKLNANSIEFGTLTTAQRDALTGVVAGTMIYNSSTTAIEAYGPSGWSRVASVGPITATGGTKYTPGNGFNYHIFTTPGTFSVTGGASPVQVLVVGAGGDGGTCGGGGGGAGGAVYHPAYPFTPGTYPVTVGASPGTSPSTSCGYKSSGNDSSFANLTGKGGGPGGGSDSQVGGAGGCGGGNSYPNGTNGGATQPSQTHSGAPPGWTNYGFAGGQNPGSAPGKGGGGTGSAGGTDGGRPASADGGAAQPFPVFPGPLFTSQPAPWQSAVGPTGLYGGGGGGSGGPGSAQGGGAPGPGGSVVDNTGGGGAGGGTSTRGASGVVLLRYPV